MTAPLAGPRVPPRPAQPAHAAHRLAGVGLYATYAEAQRAVDYLADENFLVRDVTIVGVDLMLVERVIGRLTWGRVLMSGAASRVRGWVCSSAWCWRS